MRIPSSFSRLRRVSSAGVTQWLKYDRKKLSMAAVRESKLIGRLFEGEAILVRRPSRLPSGHAPFVQAELRELGRAAEHSLSNRSIVAMRPQRQVRIHIVLPGIHDPLTRQAAGLAALTIATHDKFVDQRADE